MSRGKTDEERISRKRNTARFFVKKRHVSWVLLIGTCLWGAYGYLRMPHRKDPDFQVRTAVSLVPWPGASAEKVEQLVTKKVEERIAANAKVTKIESVSRTGLAVIYFDLDENLKDTGKEFDDIKLKLDAITDLPSGAGPINFIKDFRETPALMLTVASPKTDEAEIALRAKANRPVEVHARPYDYGRCRPRSIASSHGNVSGLCQRDWLCQRSAPDQWRWLYRLRWCLK